MSTILLVFSVFYMMWRVYKNGKHFVDKSDKAEDDEAGRARSAKYKKA